MAQPLPPGHAERLPPRSTLVLAPHFDDEILGCGGLLAATARGGAVVRVLFLTDGNGGASESSDRTGYSARRRSEAAASLAAWGGSGFDEVGVPDGELERNLPVVAEAIRRAILAQRPGRLLVPSPIEVTADHRAAFEALHRLLSAVRPGDELERITAGLELLVYEVNHPGYPDLLVDVSDELEAIERGMAAYASQEERHPYLHSAFGLRAFRTHTLDPNVKAAEGYRRLTLGDFTTRSLSGLESLLGAPSRIVEVREGPTISVIVRTKDRPTLLAEAIGSILASSYRQIEVVVVNDGGTAPVLPESQLPIVLVDLPVNVGRAAAANAGIAAAGGSWIAFLDDDDRVEREHYATLAALAAQSGNRVVYTDAAVTVWEPDAVEGWRCIERRLPYSRDFDRERLLLDNYIPLHTLLVDRTLLAETGALDESLPFFEDWDLLIRLADRCAFLHLAQVTCEYRHFRGSAHHALGERANERADFLRRKAQVLAKHAARLTPETLATAIDDLRAETVRATWAAEAAERERRVESDAFRSEREVVGAEISRLGHETVALREELTQRDEALRATYGEIERLNALVRAMEGTRAWRAHRWVEGVRGR